MPRVDVFIPVVLALFVWLGGCVQIHAVDFPETESQTSNRTFVKAAQLARILESVTPIQMMVVQHHQYTGAYPSSLDEIGLKREDMSSGLYIEDLELDQNGNILIEASTEIGEGIYVNLEHEETMGGLQTVWRCKTNLEKSALVSLPNCTHEQDVRKPVPVEP
jgi:hypothetical protein